MFKLIFFLIGLGVAIVFSAFNIGNVSDVSFGFRILKDIPVFLIAAISFLAGAVFTMPFAFYVSAGKRRAQKNKKSDSADFIPDRSPDEFSPDFNPDSPEK
ncbi:MAG: hypothetical protein PQJ61_10555 [Spirochaetales bacterium]|uniref:Lipopolysaccharide assembly protein A domain-containing protein n=1 Tax=Candidatus Thalassospirochaeta sargassi TaxID=3119039 RepID=A0AAJ1IH89_9SPIO|nr:hypothetical protein [Spirochaetales bacterium]